MSQLLKPALQDWLSAVKAWRIWVFLAWMDIRHRYRRSQLGPLWITLSMTITIYTMGFLYGKLLKIALPTYFPYLAAGMLAWHCLASLVNESAETLINAAHYIKQHKFPYGIFIFRTILRNFIVFFHTILVLLPILIFFPGGDLRYSLLLPVSLGIVFISATGYGMLIAALCTRYRDFSAIINSTIQIVFFLTPVLWQPSALPRQYQFIVGYNPFTYFVELIRAPLIGSPISLTVLLVSLAISLIGLAVSMIVFAKVRTKIIFWL